MEFVISDLPLTVRRTVSWTDCDPAGVVYTGRYTDYLLGAVMHFLRSIGHGPGSAESNVASFMPCKHMSLTFHIPLPPDEVIDIRVEVGAMRAHTFDLLARAFLRDGRLAFEGQFSPICISRAGWKKAPISESLKATLVKHQQAEESIR